MKQPCIWPFLLHIETVVGRWPSVWYRRPHVRQRVPAADDVMSQSDAGTRRVTWSVRSVFTCQSNSHRVISFTQRMRDNCVTRQMEYFVTIASCYSVKNTMCSVRPDINSTHFVLECQCCPDCYISHWLSFSDPNNRLCICHYVTLLRLPDVSRQDYVLPLSFFVFNH